MATTQFFSSQDTQSLLLTFQYFDVDGNGFISKREMQEALRVLLGGRVFSQAEMNYIMCMFDQDFDGEVSFEEFRSVLGTLEHHAAVRRASARQNQSQDSSPGPWNQPQDMEIVLQRVFESMDVDGNGTISKEELQVGLQRINVHLSDEELDPIMEQMGGEIRFDQFKSFMMTQEQPTTGGDIPAVAAPPTPPKNDVRSSPKKVPENKPQARANGRGKQPVARMDWLRFRRR